MTELKIALSMIVSETEPVDLLKRAISSVEKYIDGIFITVTYKDKKPTSSKLLDYLKSKKAHVSFWKWTYRFDEARNFAASQIPKDFYYYIWMDTDDVWRDAQNLSQIIKDAYLYNHAAVFLDYWYAVDLDEKGEIREIVIQHKRERLIRNDDTFKWIGRLHETLIEQKQENVVKVFRGESVVVHLSTDERVSKNLDRNINILEEAVKAEKRKDPRTLMYLGKAYYDRGRGREKDEDRNIDLGLAELLFKEYLQGGGKPGEDYKGGSGWSDERAHAWDYLAEMYRLLGFHDKAIKASANSLIEAPKYPSYYLTMALNYVLKKDWNRAETWLLIAKNIPMPETTIVLTPRDMKARALEIDYHIAMNKLELERAKKSAEKLVKIFPNSVEMRDRLTYVENLLIINKVSQSIVYIGRYLEGAGEKDKLQNLARAIPKTLENEQFVSQFRHRVLPPKLWNKDEIAIVCGPGFEGWSPKNVNQGIGGSESAVIYMADELTRLGYKVTVYADPREEVGNHKGVEYKQWYDLNVKDTFNILILWRAIGFVDTNFYARQTYLWTHDVPNCADITEGRLKRIDKIFVLSKYHRTLFKMAKGTDFVDIPDDKFFITSNGTIYYGFEKKPKRDPLRMIYTSSYDRGLVYLLNLWPEIKKAVPQANLHIFYGWHTYDAIYRDNPERDNWKKQMVALMNQEGIMDHGRIGHKQLAEEFLKSGIYAYPSDFSEISCISAMTAQIYGAVPVVTDYAALKETVQWGKKLDIDVTSKEGRGIYLQELIKSLKDADWQDGQRKKMVEWSQDKFTWKKVAVQWDGLFKGKVSKLVSLI